MRTGAERFSSSLPSRVLIVVSVSIMGKWGPLVKLFGVKKKKLDETLVVSRFAALWQQVNVLVMTVRYPIRTF